MKKKILLLTAASLMMSASFSQLAKNPYLENSKSIYQNEKSTQALCDTTINFDGPQVSSIGAGTVLWKAAVYMDSTDFKFYTNTLTFEAIQFQIQNNGTFDSLYLEIYENSSVSNYTTSASLTIGNLLHAQNIAPDVVLDAFGIATLDSSITVDKSKGYTFVININQTTAGFPVATDGGPQVPARSWVSTGTTYSQLVSNSLDYNWNLRVCTSGDLIVPQYDLKVIEASFAATGYEILPLDQVNPLGYNFSVDVQNVGVQSITNSLAKIEVNNGLFVDSVVIPNIGAGSSAIAMLPGFFIPTTSSVFNVEASVSQDSVDFNSADNILVGSFEISDTLFYSRTQDANFYTTAAPMFGNVYDINTDTYLKSVSAQFLNPSTELFYDGDELFAQIFAVSAGVVGDLLFTSDTLVLDSITPSTVYNFEFTFDSSNVSLFTSQYLVAVTNPGGLLINSAVNYYTSGTSFGNSDVSNPNWVESPGTYYDIDVLLSDVQLHFPSTVDTTVGVSEIQINKISVYPNPANNLVTVNGTEVNGKIQIIDITGKVIVNTISNSTSTPIDLSGIEKGIYFIKYTNNKAISTEKLIIK